MTRRPSTTAGVAALFGLAIIACVSLADSARAIDIQSVVSPHGIKAWLVQDNTIPLISMSFAFDGGGAAQDPAGKPGVANMLSGLLDEGAGNLDSQAYQARLDGLSIELGFNADRDSFGGSLRTLTENLPEAARLLRLALAEPRFDPEPVARIRADILASLKRGERNPGRLAALAMMQATFPDHPYGRPVEGTADSVAAITVDDLKAFRQRIFARSDLRIAIVGAIDATAAANLIDEIFGDLPAEARLTAVPDVVPESGKRIDVPLPLPQAVIRLSAPGLKRSDPDYIPASVATFILGGGSDSRLFKSVREDRGLAYSVGLGLDPLSHAGVVSGGTGTRADQAEEVIALIRKEIARFGKEGPTEQELASAKKYLIGSYPLQFVTSGGIADELLGIELDGLGIDYVDRRNDLIAAVTIDDVRRAAKRLFDGVNFTVVRVAPPQS